MFKKLLAVTHTNQSVDLALLILRVGISLLMITHGYPKLQKLLAGDMSFGDPIGLGVPLSLTLTVFAEFICPILIIVGLFTRPASFFLIFTMFVAVFIVHASDGLAKQEKGLLFFIPYLALMLAGPGKYSLDKFLFNK
jgi:putative oxidoreductase